MKLSISIPDYLWEAWRLRNPAVTSPSELVQIALKKQMSPRDVLESLGEEGLIDLLTKGRW